MQLQGASGPPGTHPSTVHHPSKLHAGRGLGVRGYRLHKMNPFPQCLQQGLWLLVDFLLHLVLVLFPACRTFGNAPIPAVGLQQGNPVLVHVTPQVATSAPLHAHIHIHKYSPVCRCSCLACYLLLLAATCCYLLLLAATCCCCCCCWCLARRPADLLLLLLLPRACLQGIRFAHCLDDNVLAAAGRLSSRHR